MSSIQSVSSPLPDSSLWCVLACGAKKYGNDFCKAGRTLAGKLESIGSGNRYWDLGFVEGSKGVKELVSWLGEGSASMLQKLMLSCGFPYDHDDAGKPETGGELDPDKLAITQKMSREIEGFDGYYTVNPAADPVVLPTLVSGFDHFCRSLVTKSSSLSPADPSIPLGTFYDYHSGDFETDGNQPLKAR